MFAADLYEVMMQRGKRPIYEKPEQFFALTCPTFNLRRLVRDVVLRLAGKNDKAVRQLDPGLAAGGPLVGALVPLVAGVPGVGMAFLLVAGGVGRDGGVPLAGATRARRTRGAYRSRARISL